MQNNNKKSLLAIGVLTIIFAFLSIFMVSNIYKKPNQLAFDVKGNCATNHPSIFGLYAFVYDP